MRLRTLTAVVWLLATGVVLANAVTGRPPWHKTPPASHQTSHPFQQDMNDAMLPALDAALAVLAAWSADGCAWIAWDGTLPGSEPTPTGPPVHWGNDVARCSPGAAPIASVPLDPIPVTAGVPPNPTFLFRYVASASDYQVWVAASPSGAYIDSAWFSMLEANCAAGVVCAVQLEGLYLAPGAYRWWVQTSNPNGLGPWSVPMTFVVQ